MTMSTPLNQRWLLNRRHFLRGLGATVAVPLLDAMTPLCAAAPFQQAASANAARKQAARRPRGVIFNNDGDDAFATDAPATPEGFLSVRMDHIADCGVDSVFYCTTISSVFTHDSKVLEVSTRTSGNQKNNRMPALLRTGIDPLRFAIESCRKHNIEIFWTLRMNDIHDNWFKEIRAQWKTQHPELVMGNPEEAAHFDMRDPRAIWTLADYERREVREMMVKAVEEVLDNYDVDGIDLDFLRHICYFKETRLHEAVTPAHRDLLTDMVRQIRERVLAASERKGKPILLSARCCRPCRSTSNSVWISKHGSTRAIWTSSQWGEVSIPSRRPRKSWWTGAMDETCLPTAASRPRD